ncbi:phosphonate transport system substrate-binding protein [Stackebrandtia albiflava]|uniref:Phosphonate transport system substrate-binding protein n=1 Tax=Stackebrandtia albiflava TaxID=406432 RepID=A0A562UQN0_9ACTN|nr:phosphate/phosphite/phosphonate ABC transporter substrate-binding protein [Stackebrandtia albiflava]TWJ07908.1 phosphonate transport system substrate-binding protein [Stackebrandtia albiflava]
MRPRKSLLRLAAVAGAAVLALAACGESADTSSDDGEGVTPETLVISGVPAEEGTDLSNTYTPVIKMLEEELGIPVEFQPATSYAAVIEGQRNGKIHIAQYGALAYYQAVQTGSDISVLGAMVKEKGVEPGYQSYGVVPADSDIESIEEFAGKKLCFVDISSTSGYLYPVKGLLDAGVEMGDWEENLAGGHDASAMNVASGECDAGFALDSMIESTLIEKGDLKEGDLKVVWKSDTIAEPPITMYNGLEAGLKDKIAKIFAEQANQDYLVANGYCIEGECDLTDQRIWGWQTVEDDYYTSLIEVCEATQAQACSAA